MPEGHTIHRAARDHNSLLAAQKLTVLSPQGRFADGALRLTGRICNSNSKVYCYFKVLILIMPNLGRIQDCLFVFMPIAVFSNYARRRSSLPSFPF